MKMNPVVHFEMPAKDKKRTAKFYSSVFGWKMTQLDEKMGNYLLASTTLVDEKTQMAKEPGAINGGFFDYGEQGTIPHIVIAVENLTDSIEAVKKEGGKIEAEQMDILGIGKFVMFTDTEGNLVGMLEPSPM